MLAAPLRTAVLRLRPAHLALDLAFARLAAVPAAILAAERGRFAPWLAVLTGAGSLLYFTLAREPPAWPARGGALLLLALAFLTRQHQAVRAVVLCAFSATLGFAAAQLATGRAAPSAPLPSRAVLATGRVDASEPLPDGRRLTLANLQPGPNEPPFPRTVRVRLRANDPARPEPGDFVRIRLLLRPPQPPAFPGAWDLQRDSFFSGAGGSGQALGPAEVIPGPGAAGIASWWHGVREGIAARLMADIPGPPGAVAATFLTGLTAAIPAPDRAAFRDSGLAHLLAVAGLHLGLVMGLVMGATRLGLAAWERAALSWPTRSIAGVAALAAGLLYALLVGGHVPVLRSFAMASLVVLALLAGRRAFSLRSLAMAAVGILLWAPNEVNGVSFQMSFAAVAALIAGYEALRPVLAWVRGRNGWARQVALHLFTLALTSLLAGAATAPYAAHHFGHVQIYAVLANMLAVPVAGTVILPFGLLALLLMPLGLDALPATVMGWGTSLVLAIGHATSALPAARLAPPHIPGWGLVVFSVGLAWLCLWRSRLRLLGFPPLIAGLASAWLVVPPDILVSPDARYIALVAPGRAWLAGQGATPTFVEESWAAYLARDTFADLPDIAAPDPALPCTRDACRLTAHGATALLLRRDGARPPCDNVAILLASVPARSVCPPGTLLIDRFTVWRDGAHAVWLHPGGAEILSDRAWRGDRPWVPPPPTPRPRRPNLPMAAADDLPPLPTDAASPEPANSQPANYLRVSWRPGLASPGEAVMVRANNRETFMRTNPPFRADQVGSLLRPVALKHAREQVQEGKMSAEQLRTVEDEEIRQVIRKQEEVGLQAVTDGEFRRAYWHFDFLEHLDGVESIDADSGMNFKGGVGIAKALRVMGKIGFTDHPMIEHFRFLRQNTDRVAKMTIPGPSMLHYRGGRKMMNLGVYPDMDEFYADLGAAYNKAVHAFYDAGCRYLQLDDISFAYLCDPEQREMLRARGDDPEKQPEIYAGMVRAALADKPSDLTVTMHLCRGNFRSTFIASGGYEPVADVLFNSMPIDGYFMEWDSDRAGGFEPLRFLPKWKQVVLGLVTSKTGVLEQPDAIKRAIEEAAQFAPLNQLCLSPQCGFASTEAGNTLAEEEQWAKLRMIVDVAQDVWGGPGTDIKVAA